MMFTIDMNRDQPFFMHKECARDGVNKPDPNKYYGNMF